ncbi:hypothetical protein TH8_08735 [Thalassospira profundimaris]|uniref:hypothetical protein n=1 Tax=Thalassospira TaxID=168934 RepID=UPI000287257A|nr:MULTISPECIES: hypothetical protein [Thalassospira]EKF09275.1 hypothetical protein TH2_05273 [Thalassospira profundimaris WP0211]MBC06180.1 acyl-CoA transferase [Thalassospira sp.]RCK26777.1 hypothetical protein TH8_08735 [Thalassospira profundimaris]|tara:strand:+ start:40 stop:477 length:438 start_codon:yes stop_codon:yes gene_type:complete
MPATKTEQILDALKTRLETIPDATVERNSVVPEKISTGGLLILRDGTPGEPEQALGGFGGVYCRQEAEIDITIEDGDATSRDAAFDALLQMVGSILDADPTLGGLAFGMTYGRPEIDTEAVVGAPAIKAGTLIVAIEFEADTALG